MGLRRHRGEKFGQTMQSFQDRRSLNCPLKLTGFLILLALLSGCSNATNGTNTNSTAAAANLSGNANAGSTASTRHASIDFKEPERYSVTMTFSAQPAADASSTMATRQVGFAKLGSDRRWSFAFEAPLGHIVYLEKSGLMYVVFVDRNQYVEVAPGALGFQPSDVLTPAAIAARLKPRSEYEQLGLEPVDGRTAVKYRVSGAEDARGKIEGVIFVDQETGLPVRYEFSAIARQGAVLQVAVEARDVKLNPDPLQFDVPAGMKKITPQEAKSHIEAFAASVGFFSEFMGGKVTMPSVANAVRSNRNKNAGTH